MNLSFVGKVRFARDDESSGHRLLVAIPCHIGGLSSPVHVLLDTAAEWSVLDSELARALGVDTEEEGDLVTVSTRHGRMRGALIRLALRFPARDGEGLEAEIPWLACADWPGPPVLGWRGGLEWGRFAVDPAAEEFYFAPAD